jgi:hypothetical protein
VQTEDPYWLSEAYNDSINMSDTGLVMRNVFLSKSASTLIYFLFNRRGKFLDFAGGYGLFTRLMRDIGFDFYTTDPFTPNLFAKGFSYTDQKPIELITTFESFEHFADPIAEIEKMLAIADNIFFSTQLVPNPLPKPGEWEYYGLDHGQHIALYTPQTLEFIAHKYGLNVYSVKGYHLFTKKRISNLMFKLLVAGGRIGLASIVKKLMKTKTFEDNKTIKRDLKTKIENTITH